MSSHTVIVSISLGTENIRVGQLWCHNRKNRESASFEYDQKWLEHPEKFALEPALQLLQVLFIPEAESVYLVQWAILHPIVGDGFLCVVPKQ